MVKRCKFDPRIRCWDFRCAIFDPISGKVRPCPLFRGRSRITPRKVVSQ